MSKLTLARLKELLHYDPKTGQFTWLANRSRIAKIGAFAGTDHSDGYTVIGIAGRVYKAHRLAWFYVHGEWPSDQVDHINHDRKDNRIANLRLADNSKNQANSRARKTNKSGLKGVYWNKSIKKWHAQIYAQGRKRHLGFFKTPQAAHSAYSDAAVAFHGEYANP